MDCVIWRVSWRVLLSCCDGFSPIQYSYARIRFIGTSCCHVRVSARDHGTVCCGLLILVMLELCCVGGLEMEVVLLVGMFHFTKTLALSCQKDTVASGAFPLL